MEELTFYDFLICTPHSLKPAELRILVQFAIIGRFESLSRM